MTVGYTLGMEPSGREFVVLVVKRSYLLPGEDGAVCPLAPVQDELRYADEFFGPPGHSAPRFEMDFAQRKPRCDVLVDAVAHAPGGRPVERLGVGVKIDGWSKVFEVVGDRTWIEGVVQPGQTRPRPFQRLTISYDVAFGGLDPTAEDDALPAAYLDNPVGRGWHRHRTQSRITGKPLPNTEARGEPVTVPWGDYRPMSFGPVGRGWPHRLRHAGTYDQGWLDNTFPFLPADFDVMYFQAAPADQQIDPPKGGELVQLANLTPAGRTAFRLPRLDLPVTFARRRKADVAVAARVDTVLIEPERGRLVLTWRANLPLERDIFEATEAIVGHRSKAFWRARRLGKSYYPGLGALARDRAGSRPE